MTREEETREKEISQAAESKYFVTKAEEFAWIHGAEWADEHPREGLWDAQKVCNILRNKMNSNWFYEKMEKADYDSIIKDLRKVMEE